MQRFFVSLLVVLAAALFVSTVEAQEKRAAMGGSAFGGLDRIPSYLQKFYRQRNNKRDPTDFGRFAGYPQDLSYY
ncbi:unnamed protein product [Caenorhabditis auriculariae]|uniref:Uncharacterized protein n=1 Tax=Caenorhabditis auriculariae TaxID=2777116 RepID=A0A8S1HRR5_9PELO|nr:unnamed protein product [Caenorhabditis auriculariae]